MDDPRNALSEKFVKPLESLSGDFRNFVALVENTLDIEAVERHEFIVSSKLDEELKRIHDLKTKTYRAMQSAAEDVAAYLTSLFNLSRLQTTFT